MQELHYLQYVRIPLPDQLVLVLGRSNLFIFLFILSYSAGHTCLYCVEIKQSGVAASTVGRVQIYQNEAKL